MPEVCHPARSTSGGRAREMVPIDTDEALAELKAGPTPVL
jgi:hypothetical protein